LRAPGLSTDYKRSCSAKSKWTDCMTARKAASDARNRFRSHPRLLNLWSQIFIARCASLCSLQRTDRTDEQTTQSSPSGIATHSGWQHQRLACIYKLIIDTNATNVVHSPVHKASDAAHKAHSTDETLVGHLTWYTLPGCHQRVVASGGLLHG
jgi:hypothetical protein